MEYLVFLNRFEQDKRVLERKFDDLDVMITGKGDDCLAVEAVNPEKLLNMQEISKVFKLATGWKELNFKDLKEDSLKAVRENDIKKYKIQTKFHNKIKISAKSIYKHINPYLKHEGFLPDEDNFERVIFIEFKRENNGVFYRVSYSLKEWNFNSGGINYSNFVVVIENPSLVEEVSDFLRLGWIFKIPLFIVTSNKDFDRLLKKAKEITKGIDYERFKIVISERLVEGYTYVGFSKLAKENEVSLKKFFSKKDDGKKIALVFGDDKFGLTQGMRDKMNYMFRLTPEMKKPLKASQALSYVLGLYSCLKLQ